MDYVINCLGLPFNGSTVSSKSLGGSESAAFYLARELVKRGHRCTVFTTSRDEGVFDGVTYCFCGEVTETAPLGERFEFYAMNTPHDVLIAQRHPLAFCHNYNAKVRLWQTHDLALHRTTAAVLQQMWNVSAVTVVSEWHKKQMMSVYPIPASSIYVVPNGVDASLYVDPQPVSLPASLFDDKRQGKLALLYQSRPERGLEHLVRPGGIMDRLRHVDVHLFVCGYENTTDQMRDYYDQLNAWADALPNVTRLGALSKPELARLQYACDVLCYPTEFEEVSCITAMEAMHAGLPMVTSDCAALTETCAGAGVELIPLKDGQADENAFVVWLTLMAEDTLHAEESRNQLEAMVQAQLAAAHNKTWSAATDALESVVRECFAQKSDTATARHALKNSDVPLCREVLDFSRSNTITDKLRSELHLFDFLRSDEEYKAHYDKWCGKYYADVPQEDRCVPPSGARAQAVEMCVGKLVSESHRDRPLRVLDYGCAHGHYTITLAKKFPNVEFLGVDISIDAVREAVAWAQRDNVGNVSFSRADSIDAVNGSFDVILLCEILEHVRSHTAMLNSARALLTEGGALVTTTPYGPWEWLGRESYKKGREHCQHFERTDLVEIFDGMNPEMYCAPGGASNDGTPVGSWVCVVKPGDKAFGMANMRRKWLQTLPEQTVSACLIVKDGANVLRKALDTLVPWVSEVIIGIDPATTDDTAAVIDKFAVDNPWLPVTHFEGKRAVDDGFDEARNFVCDRAIGDWILWMDADEELIGGQELVKLLRPNMHDAYCVPQIHFSVDPPQVLTTDYPSRIYRNHKGIRFYGRVHEHPETAPGEAIPSATMRHEIRFAHNGYVTEDVRRARYYRNLPLLMRDVKEHPNRILNKFLLIRDLAQGVGFELQQNGGASRERFMDHRSRALRIVELWRELLSNPKPVSRMLIDALPYYTLASEVIGGWFAADVSFSTQKLSLSTQQKIQGKFLTTQDFNGLLTRLSQEATQHYDGSHL